MIHGGKKVRGVATLVLLCAATALLRATSPPVYHGVPPREVSRSEALSAPFGDDLRGDCNAFLSLLARSLLREGFSATGGIPLLNVQDAEPEHFVPYPNHPPGIPWVTAAAFSAFGDREATSRAVALCFSTLTTLLVVLVCAAVHRGAALAAWAALTFLPAGWYWGTHLNYELPTLLCTTAFLALTATGPGRGRRTAAAAILAAGFLLDLVALFAAGALILESLGRSSWRRALGWTGYGLALLGGWWAWRHVQIGRLGDGATLGESHLLAVTFWSAELGVLDWCRTAPAHVWSLLGGWPLLVWAAELVHACVRDRSRFDSRWLRRSSWLAMLAFVVPAQRSYDHEYYALYFLVPVALAVWRLAARLPTPAAGRGRAVTTPAACALALALALTGVLAERDRPVPSVSRPSAALLGQSLQEAEPDPRVQIALDPGARFPTITLAYYCGRPVGPLPEGDEDGLRFREWLQHFGLGLCPLVRARDPEWPGRGGFEELPLPAEYREHVPRSLRTLRPRSSAGTRGEDAGEDEDSPDR